jgi:intein/homing endonuclease
MDTRRCNSESCKVAVAKRSAVLDAPLVTILDNPVKDWQRLAYGSVRIAKRVIDVDWKKFNQDNYVMAHCSIVCSVKVEDNGYYIDPVCSELVNNNGNAWTNEVLLATFRTFIGAENFCFIEGTRILMADGTYKEIQNVKVGDKVINRKGIVDTVKNTGKRWSDSLVKISSTDIMCRDLFVTSEHPFWVFHARENCPKTGRPNDFNRDKDFYHLDSWLGFSVGVHRARGEIFPSGLTPQWKEAGQLDANRDFLTHPVSDVETPVADINENRAELIGWFLAEGCYAHTNHSSDEDSGIVFNLGNDEQDVAERIQGLLWTEFSQFVTRPDCQVRIEETESGSLNVRLSNREVARFFYEWCGKWAWAKKLNEKALWLPKKLQALILKHCINGDGTGEQEFRGYSLEMKSRSLIQQLLFIAWRLGLNPTYRETGVLPRYTECEVVDGYEVFTEPATGKKSRPGYGLWFTVRDSMALNAVCGHIDERIASRQERAYSHIFDSADGKWLVAKIEGFEKVSVGAFVYNIEVENDNSYVAEGVVVHNCEHVQISELSKGKILDAVIRPVTHKNKIGSADVYWVDILVGTARKHTDLVKRITSGELTTLSMGCSANQVQCSKCGIVLTDDDKNCEHLDNEMLQYFNDEKGVRRIVAELCGKSLVKDGKRVGDPKSVQFIEASWVERPAFTGAVLNHYISEVPKLSSIMGFNHARLAECVEDLFKLRVADVQGMTVLRVARAEWIRRQREATIEKVARSLYLGK